MRIRSRGTRRVLRGSGTGENESKETGACRLWVSSWAKVSELSCETGSSVAEKAVTDRIVEYADSSEAGNRESSAVAGSFPFRPTSGFSDGWRLWVRSSCAGSPDVPVAEYQAGGFNRGGVGLEESGLPRAPSLVTGESDKGGTGPVLLSGDEGRSGPAEPREPPTKPPPPEAPAEGESRTEERDVTRAEPVLVRTGKSPHATGEFAGGEPGLLGFSQTQTKPSRRPPLARGWPPRSSNRWCTGWCQNPPGRGGHLCRAGRRGHPA